MSYDPCASDPADDRRVYPGDDDVVRCPGGCCSTADDCRCEPRPDGAIDCLTCAGQGWVNHPTERNRGLLCQFCAGRGWVALGDYSRDRIPEAIDESLEVTRRVVSR